MKSILERYSKDETISIAGVCIDSSSGISRNKVNYVKLKLFTNGETINCIGFDRKQAPIIGSNIKITGKVSIYKEEKQIEITAIENVYDIKNMSKTKKLISYYRSCIEKEYQGSMIKHEISNLPRIPSKSGLINNLSGFIIMNNQNQKNYYDWFKKISLAGKDTTFLVGYPIIKKTYPDNSKKFSPLAYIEAVVNLDGEEKLSRVSEMLLWNYGALEILGVPPEERDFLKEKLTEISEDLSSDSERLSAGIAFLEIYLNKKFGLDHESELVKYQIDSETEIIYSHEVCFDGQANSVYDYLLRDLGDLLNKSDYELSNGPLSIILGSEMNHKSDTEFLKYQPLSSNEEQYEAIDKALQNEISCVTGPPGTGKSQFVANLALTAMANNKSVLIASKNNQAVDVAINRIKRACPNSWPIRSGTREHRKAAANNLFKPINSKHTQDGIKEKIDDYKEKINYITKLELEYKNYDSNISNIIENIKEIENKLTTIKSARSLINDESILNINKELDILALNLLKPLKFMGKNKEINLRKTYIIKSLAELNSKHNNIFISISSKVVEKYNKKDMSPLGECYKILENLKNTNIEIENLSKEEDIYKRKLVETKSKKDLQEEILKLKTAQTELSREIVSLQWDGLINSQPKIKMLESLSLSLGSGFTSSIKNNASTSLKVAPVWGVTNLSVYNSFSLDKGLFDLVIIDEASQCDIASILPLIFRGKKVVLVGDPNQLQHITSLKAKDSKKLSKDYGLIDLIEEGFDYCEFSAYSLCFSKTNATTTLISHYRSHPAISEFVNKYVYDDKLVIYTNPLDYKKGDGVFWHEIASKAVVGKDGGSLKNIDEAKFVVKLIGEVSKNSGSTSIGVVTPFKEQADLITSYISKNKEYDNLDIRVATAHKFQGDEREIIIISTVISEDTNTFKKDFANNFNLINVAVTRARRQLHIVGSKDICVEMGGLLGALANYSSMLRQNNFDSPAEEKIYNSLDSSKYNIEKQVLIGEYKVDLLISKPESNVKLVVECDGHPYHLDMLRDNLRDSFITNNGYLIYRVPAKDALKNTKKVILEIDNYFKN